MTAYDFNATLYERASGLQRDWGLRLLADLRLRGDERVLDLGCGHGALTADLATAVPRGSVLGIDNSPSMIERAAQLARANLGFRRMDINDLDFAAEFDLIYSNATLHWILDHRRLLQRVRRALRPGGQVRFGFGAEGNSPTFFAVVREAMAREEFARHFAAFRWPWYMPSVQEYEGLLAEAGFAESRAWGENNDRLFADSDEMTRWIDQPCLVPFLPCLPEAERGAFRDAVVAETLRRARRPGGRCSEAFRRIHVWARA